MADALMVELAQAITFLLNERNWSIEAKAKHGWQPIEGAEDLRHATVWVVATGKSSTRISRTQRSHRITIEVTVQKAIGANPGEVDAVERLNRIAAFVQEVEDYLGDLKVTNGETWIAHAGVESLVELSKERLDDGIFSMRIESVFELLR